jgi:glycosyltransferase involved in cell wall biosynthesis
MLTVILNIYACGPNLGSEKGQGWLWCTELAKHCDMHVITEGEFKKQINDELLKLSDLQREHLHFYYNPIGGNDENECAKIRKMCWNQGDWRFYYYYRKWQLKTLEIAQQIIKDQKEKGKDIDIIHQLNMLGFREPGFLFRIKGKPFVWGPIGGLQLFPDAYMTGAPLKMKLFLKLKNFLNNMIFYYGRRVDNAVRCANMLVSTTPVSYQRLKKVKGVESTWIPEMSCKVGNPLDNNLNRFYDEKLRFIWIGKFDYRKRLDIAIRAVAEAKNKNIILQVFGSGNESQVKSMHDLSERLGVSEQIEWMGNRPNQEVHEALRNGHVFFFTSVSDDTSTVMLEAVSEFIPVLNFRCCGMQAINNETIGVQIDLTNPEQSVKDFAEKINYLEKNRNVLKDFSANCAKRQNELSWNSNIAKMIDVYKQAIINNNNYVR